jgi:Protein phosphatase 2C
MWDQAFVDSVHFVGDPVVATPDVTELTIKPEDEFFIIASDGLWWVLGPGCRAMHPAAPLCVCVCLQGDGGPVCCELTRQQELGSLAFATCRPS